MCFVVPQFFSKPEFVQFEYRHFFVEKLGDFPEFVITFGIAGFDQLFVEQKRQIGQLAGQIVVGTQVIGLNDQLLCSVGQTACDVLGFYKFFELYYIICRVFFFIFQCQCFGFIQYF